MAEQKASEMRFDNISSTQIQVWIGVLNRVLCSTMPFFFFFFFLQPVP